MIFDRQQQRLLLKGKEYTFEEISQLIAGGAEANSPAYWDLYLFLNEWFNDSPVITVHTSGSTGIPKELMVRKDQMMQSARLTCEFLNLKKGESALLCMNLRYIGAMMVVVRSLVAGLNLIVRPASGHPLADIKEPLRFVAMVPLQVYNTLQVPEEKERLKQTDILIIGGGAVDEALRIKTILLKEMDNNVLKQILRSDDEGQYATRFQSCHKWSKRQSEDGLSPFIPVSFVITSVPDQRLGQAVTLLLAGQPDIEEIGNKLQEILEPYYRPKHILTTESIPQTENGIDTCNIIGLQCFVTYKRGIND